MTERKPADMSFRSWVEQQISEAEERGAFDNLRGAGCVRKLSCWRGRHPVSGRPMRCELPL
jgi:hypothetical protein